ncbi:MAG: hypothetical protein HDT35_08755, partial [Clostridiales bacterium]|nr:hypothetical protein [Clostridiales bacterium]
MREQIRLGKIFTLVGGGTPSTSKEKYWGNGVPWFSSADISLDGKISCRRAVTPLGIQNSTTNVVPAQTVVVVTRVGLGKVAKLPCDMCFSQDMQALRPISQTPPYNESFLMYQLSHIMSHVKFQGRGTTISGITKKQLSDIVLFLPPIVEQNRIVARIEELSSQLDASVNELKTAKERLKVYRQAVLKEAFSPCSERSTLGSICRHITDGDHMPPPKAKSGIPFIMISNVNQNKIGWTNTAFVNKEYYDAIDEKRCPQNGDVLYTVTGS